MPRPSDACDLTRGQEKIRVRREAHVGVNKSTILGCGMRWTRRWVLVHRNVHSTYIWRVMARGHAFAAFQRLPKPKPISRIPISLAFPLLSPARSFSTLSYTLPLPPASSCPHYGTLSVESSPRARARARDLLRRRNAALGLLFRMRHFLQAVVSLILPDMQRN